MVFVRRLSKLGVHTQDEIESSEEDDQSISLEDIDYVDEDCNPPKRQKLSVALKTDDGLRDLVIKTC